MNIYTLQIGDNSGVTLTCYIQDSHLFGEKTPAVVVCPGGGYTYYNEDEGENVAMSFYAQGFSAFVLRYSVGMQALWPRPVVDAAMALKLIRQRAEEWRIAEDAIAIGGFSAGGHLAASIGTMWNDPEIKKKADIKAEEDRPNALFLIYPAISMEMPVVKDGILTTEPADCAARAGAGTPPAFMVHSYGDTVAPLEQSLMFAKAMYDNDRPIECHFYTPGQHSALVRRSRTINERSVRVPGYNDWLERCVEWLWDIFGRDRPDMAPDSAPDMVEGWKRPHGGRMGCLFGSSGLLFEKIFGVPQPRKPGISSRTLMSELMDRPEHMRILKEYFPILENTKIVDVGADMPLSRLMAIYGYREDEMSFEIPMVTGEMAEMLNRLNSL